MIDVQAPVVVSTYPTRDHAGELVGLLRKVGITTAAVPSDQHAGAWDVLVTARDTARAMKMVDAMRALDCLLVAI